MTTRTKRSEISVVETWICPQCGTVYESPIHLLEARCNNRHGNKKVSMKLVEKGK